MDLTADQQRALLDFARKTIREALGESTSPQREVALKDPLFSQLAGCFVTLHDISTRQLRGCMGRLEANEPLADSLSAAASSVLTDPRFVRSPVVYDELDRLEIELSVISPLRPTQHVLDFDRMNDGIYLTIGQRAGCFLPQVARETGWSAEQLLDRLCTEKMALPADAWQGPEAQLSIFTTIVIGPEPFTPTGRPDRNPLPRC